MINKLFQFLFSLSLILLVSSCAQVVPLSGGEKDTDAPLLISSSPKNKQLLKAHLKSAIQYFNKWGWIYDMGRSRLNAKCLNQFSK